MQAIKGTNKFFFVFLIKRCKQNNNKVKDWKRETPLAKILFIPDNGTRKLVDGAMLM
jgi:hypothetical protein